MERINCFRSKYNARPGNADQCVCVVSLCIGRYRVHLQFNKIIITLRDFVSYYTIQHLVIIA